MMHIHETSKSRSNIINYPFLLMRRSSIFLIILFIFIQVLLSNNTTTFQSAIAQSSSSSSSISSESAIKGLLTGAIQALKGGSSNKTLEHLNAIDQELSSSKQNLSSTLTQTTKLLVQDTIQALHDGNASRASTYLNLAAQYLGVQVPINQTSSTNKINTSSNFLTYNDPVSGMRIQYPSNWSVTAYPYNPAANNTIVGFFSQAKTSSQLGNISGVSGSFVPYLDIFVFGSKNMSLDKIINGTINKFHNNTSILINQSKPSVVKNSHPAHMLIYNTIVGGDEFFKKMQLYTIFGSKVYLISFTSQESLFPKYMPIVQKMASSFEVQNIRK
jgi:hypothetical protein